MGSAGELEYQWMPAHDLNYLQDEAHQGVNDELIELKKMLNAFIQKIKTAKS